MLGFVRRLVGARRVKSWRARQRATWDKTWWTAVDAIETTQRGQSPADVDLSPELIEKLEVLIHEAGPGRALELLEFGREAALSYVVAQVGAFDMAWLEQCARTGDSITPAEPAFAHGGCYARN
jgi:hypothetical protein